MGQTAQRSEGSLAAAQEQEGRQEGGAEGGGARRTGGLQGSSLQARHQLDPQQRLCQFSAILLQSAKEKTKAAISAAMMPLPCPGWHPRASTGGEEGDSWSENSPMPGALHSLFCARDNWASVAAEGTPTGSATPAAGLFAIQDCLDIARNTERNKRRFQPNPQHTAGDSS